MAIWRKENIKDFHGSSFLWFKTSKESRGAEGTGSFTWVECPSFRRPCRSYTGCALCSPYTRSALYHTYTGCVLFCLHTGCAISSYVRSVCTLSFIQEMGGGGISRFPKFVPRNKWTAPNVHLKLHLHWHWYLQNYITATKGSVNVNWSAWILSFGQNGDCLGRDFQQRQ